MEKEFAAQNQVTEKYILHRRFDRMARLVGDESMQTLFNLHVMVIGVGGVGSWTAESLVRSGVGEITLVDFDEICITNTNRQLPALQGMVGKKKVQVMAERLQKINPQAQINIVPKFYSSDTSQEILSQKPDWVVDAIDNISAKCLLISECKKQNIPIVSSMGAGSRIDPLKIKIADLSASYQDPFAQQVRKSLRNDYGFPQGGKEEFGVPCVFSEEEQLIPETLSYDINGEFKCVCPQGQNNFHSCEKRNIIHGTASFVTGTFGLAISSYIIRKVSKK